MKRFLFFLFSSPAFLFGQNPCGDASIYATIPAVPVPGNALSVVTEAWFCTMACEGFNETVTWLSPNEVEIYTYHCPGMLAALCQDFDTLSLGSPAAGAYIIHYYAYQSLDCMSFTPLHTVTDTIIIGCSSTLQSGFNWSDNQLTVDFTDASTSGTPLTWAWDFGDGQTSALQNPQHTYSASGSYYVCLTVTDSCGQDTFCDSVQVIFTATENEFISSGLVISPNPSTGLLQITIHENVSGFISVKDLSGRTLHQMVISPGQKIITEDLSFLPAGAYLINLNDRRATRWMRN